MSTDAIDTRATRTRRIAPGLYELPTGDTIERVEVDYGRGCRFTDWRWNAADGSPINVFTTKRDAVAAYDEANR